MRVRQTVAFLLALSLLALGVLAGGACAWAGDRLVLGGYPWGGMGLRVVSIVLVAMAVYGSLTAWKTKVD